MLKGKKTYMVALGAVLLAVGGYLHGDLSWAQAVDTFITGGGLASLRSALNNINLGGDE